MHKIIRYPGMKNWATEKQVKLMVKLGVDEHRAKSVSFDEAKLLINELIKESGKPTEKQIALLVKLGESEDFARSISFGEAKKRIDELIKKQREELKKQIESIDIDLRDYAGKYVTLEKLAANELAGPCPKCSGTDRFHVREDFFFCRHCYPFDNSKPHDVVAFVQWVDNCDVREAVAKLTNTPVTAANIEKRQPEKKDCVKRSEWDLAKANGIVECANKRLLDDSDAQAQAGRDYLDRRGIAPDAWVIFKLGYRHETSVQGTNGKKKAPSITIPWYRNGKLVAINHRFLEKQGKDKTKLEYGSSISGVLFGGQTIDENIPESSTILVCEGEINAVSIWQATRNSRLDVLSLGSESASLTDGMIKYLSRYARVMFWLDKEGYVSDAMASIPGSYGIRSVDNRDANDFLVSGQLGALIATHRFRAARNKDEQLKLIGDLERAASIWPGPDALTMKAIDYISSAIGEVQGEE